MFGAAVNLLLSEAARLRSIILPHKRRKQVYVSFSLSLTLSLSLSLSHPIIFSSHCRTLSLTNQLRSPLIFCFVPLLNSNCYIYVFRHVSLSAISLGLLCLWSVLCPFVSGRNVCCAPRILFADMFCLDHFVHLQVEG